MSASAQAKPELAKAFDRENPKPHGIEYILRKLYQKNGGGPGQGNTDHFGGTKMTQLQTTDIQNKHPEKMVIEKLPEQKDAPDNDQVATDIRLWLRKKIDVIDTLLTDLQNSLLSIAESNIYTLIPGYTHMQRAQPLSLAHHLLAYLEMFERDRERLREVRTRVNISPLGAAALAGTKIKIDRYFTAEELGFEAVKPYHAELVKMVKD